jgi:hypothetical protein
MLLLFISFNFENFSSIKITVKKYIYTLQKAYEYKNRKLQFLGLRRVFL